MIGQSLQRKETAVTVGYLSLAVLLLFQSAMIGGIGGGVSEGEEILAPDATETPVIEPSEHAGQPAQARKQHVTVYQVQPGDSLYWIAATYGLSVQELKALNSLDSDSIRVGQRLVVPLDTVKYYPAGVTLSAQEVEWLAQMIHAEARGEPYVGQVAVGAVIINRMLSPQFPNTLRGVLFQRNAFQPIQNGSFYLTPNESARRAALEALAGKDPTGGALFFFNPRQSTDRFMHSRPTKVTIGSHRFTT
ncbi:MAG: LysM peptidoglycan-binding domain-containing protein [Firmicutes bacterium]|nr:LysM peptidoglycan-binding domain-containing protein [Bacillota bacterium]